jgi:Fe-S cluster biogenesis protein NfuA
VAVVKDEVEGLIAEVLRPLIEADGGGIELVRVEESTVVVRLLAACGGCPGAPYTKASVIEPVLSRGLGRTIRVKLERSPGRPSSPDEDD